MHIKLRRGVIRHRSIALLPIGFSIDENGNVSQHIDIYPNPTNGAFNLELKGIEDPKARVEIWDLAGRQHFNEAFDIANGNMQLRPKLNQGVYIVRVTNGKLTYATQRLVVTP